MKKKYRLAMPLEVISSLMKRCVIEKNLLNHMQAN